MFSGVTLGQYFPGLSVLHRLDPRAKILLTFLYIACVFIAGNFYGYALIAAFLLVMTFVSRIGCLYLIRGMKPILLIVAVTFVLNALFFSEGTTLVSWGILQITTGGLCRAAAMAARLILLILGTQLLTLTTSPISLTDGMESLLKPAAKIGFPAHEMAMMMSIALRFIPTLLQEADKITKAQVARGADFESGNLFRRAKAMVPLLVPLFVSAFRRADELAQAMESRCYRGGEGRTKLNVLSFSKIDLYAALVTLALLAALILLNRL